MRRNNSATAINHSLAVTRSGSNDTARAINYGSARVQPPPQPPGGGGGQRHRDCAEHRDVRRQRGVTRRTRHRKR
jgi:hypothetical protein